MKYLQKILKTSPKNSSLDDSWVSRKIVVKSPFFLHIRITLGKLYCAILLSYDSSPSKHKISFLSNFPVFVFSQYLGSSQIMSPQSPNKAVRMEQAQEAVGRIKVRQNLAC